MKKKKNKESFVLQDRIRCNLYKQLKIHVERESDGKIRRCFGVDSVRRVSVFTDKEISNAYTKSCAPVFSYYKNASQAKFEEREKST